MKFKVTLDRDEDEARVVACPSIPGCICQDKIRGEALGNIEDAIAHPMPQGNRLSPKTRFC